MIAHEVFISYSSKDKNVADAVCAALEQNQIRCWIAPRDILPGTEWGEQIIEAISTTKIMVLIFSSAANQSQQVLREVERAVNKNVIIIPFRIENVLPTKSMEYFLYSTHWLDALTPDLEKHIQYLVTTVTKLLSAPSKTNFSKASPPLKRSTDRKNQWFYITIGIAVAMFCFSLVIIFKDFLFSNFSNHPTVSDNTPAVSEVTENNQEPQPQTDHQRPEPQIPIKPSFPEIPDKVDNTPLTPIPNLDKPSTPQEIADIGERGSTGLVELKIGDCIRFGNYNGQPLEWRVIHIDAYGQPLLFANRIISFKPFDAAESGAFNQSKDGRKFDTRKDETAIANDYSLEELRQMKGSNSWTRSNLREWLNSREKRVKFSTMPPTADAVSGGVRTNAFDDEPGFLYNFSEAEYAMIKPVTRKALISVGEKDENRGGAEWFSFSQRSKPRQAVANYDSAYYKNVTDKVFLLSIKEVVDYVEDRGWSLKASITSEAKDRDQVKFFRGQYGSWWLMTPQAQSVCEMLVVNVEGEISTDYVSMAGCGVRPAMYLNSSKLALLGDGTETNPFTFKR